MEGFPRSLVPDVVGLTRRQVLYLAEQQIVAPSVKGPSGRGSMTIYSRDDLRRLRVIAALARLARGDIAMPVARETIRSLEPIAESAWEGMWLVVDFELAFICNSESEALESLRRSDAVIVIDLGAIERGLDHEVRRRRSPLAA